MTRTQALEQLDRHIVSCDGFPSICPSCREASRIVNETGLSNLTLIVMSRNRPKMLAQTLAYYRRMMPDAKLVVADGTGVETSYWDRLKAAVREVVTPYAVIASDDDVFVAEGLHSAIEALANNPAAIAAHGVYYGAYIDSDDEVAFHLETASQAYTADSGDVRIAEVFTSYQQTMYAVQRTDWLAANTLPPSLTSEHFSELLFTLQTVIGGTVLAIDEPYMIRNQQLSQNEDWIYSFMGHPTVAWLSDSEEFAAQYLSFRSKLSYLLYPTIGCEKFIDTLYGIYWSQNFEPSLALGALRRRGFFGTLDQADLQARLKSKPKSADFYPARTLRAVTRNLRNSGWPRYLDLP